MQETAAAMNEVYNSEAAAVALSVGAHPSFADLVASNTFLAVSGDVLSVPLRGNLADTVLKDIVYHVDMLSRYRDAEGPQGSGGSGPGLEALAELEKECPEGGAEPLERHAEAAPLDPAGDSTAAAAGLWLRIGFAAVAKLHVR